MRYRQLERLAEFGASSPLGQDALHQLQSAVILHIDCAWREAKRLLGHLVRLRCPSCGQRHLWGEYQISRHFWCVGGWWWYVRNFLRVVAHAAFHGID